MSINTHKEISFETTIINALNQQGGYTVGDARTFDATRALFSPDIITFIQHTQPQKWKVLEEFYGVNAGESLLDSLVKELAVKGTLHVLRHGFKCFGKTFRLAYFAPNSAMNPDAWNDYQKNRLTVTRQVHHSPAQPEASIDLVLAVNGLPVVTMELKNPLTGQTVHHAIRQYKEDRNPADPLFRFKERALVHFAVDPDQVFMTTRLAGKDTVFLPFNKGHNFGAGNPPAAQNYRTAYLWEDILSKDSLLDILARFLHLRSEEKQISTEKGIKKLRKETLIFPRYHQLDAARRLINSAKTKGAGHNYLIQHSAGSGKSNSIAWLAHRLASLHNEHDQKVFDTVVVITDRRLLDQQLQSTIYQFEHKQGVVQKIDEDTQQLAKALSGGVPIIISTIQKFPFIAQALDTLEKKGMALAIETAGRRFAVVVDEAHSSQSGETAMELRKILNKDGIASAIAEQLLTDMEEDTLSEDAKRELLKDMLKRPSQPNLSFFAFTATPKFKTLAVFNEPGDNGNAPFHLYSMRQAIEEGFIMDVLAHYTTYKTYYGLIKSIEEDPEVPKKKAAKALARFMSLHPYNIRQKVEVIIEHFMANTRHKIGGRAKAMVVTESRLHAVRYKLEFDRYIKEKGYKGIKSLVAFSGTVTDPDFPQTAYTEAGMNNGIKESELPEKFASEDYQVLLVAEKYQTGFDQPLLHTMYVDKRLSGIQAVQTLSRLNRIAVGKEDTFVLDFVNDEADIYAAFKPYYEATPKGENVDAQDLYMLQHRIHEWQVFDRQDINALCEVWFKNKKEPSAADHKAINAILDQAVTQFSHLPEENQDHLRGQLKAFMRLYAFLSQIIPYQDSELEKLYTYIRFLLAKLPPKYDGLNYHMDDDVALRYYRLQKISDGSISLHTGDATPLKGPTDVGTGEAQDEHIRLSLLVDRLNERFGTEFTKADELFFDQVTEAAVNNEKLREVAKANTLENFDLIFEKMVEGLFIERMEGNEDIFARLMNDSAFRNLATEYLVKEVYHRIRGKDK